MTETPYGHLIEQILCEPDVSILSKFYNRKVEREQIKSIEEQEKREKQWIRRQMLDECHNRKPIPPMTLPNDRSSVQRPVDGSEESREELRLKLIATRGVVTLFNAIATHQNDLGSRLSGLLSAQRRADGLIDESDDEIELNESRKKEAFRAEHASKKRLVKSLRSTDHTRGYDMGILKAISTDTHHKKRNFNQSADTDNDLRTDSSISNKKRQKKRQMMNMDGNDSNHNEDTHEWGPLAGGFIENLIDKALDDRQDNEEGDVMSEGSDNEDDRNELFKIDETLSDVTNDKFGGMDSDDMESEGSDRSAESLAREMGIELSSGEDNTDDDESD